MGFDPLNSGDYNRFESTSGSGGSGGKGGNGWIFWFLLLMVAAAILEAVYS